MNFKDIIDLYIKRQEFRFINGKLYNSRGTVIFENNKPERDYTVYTTRKNTTNL